MSLNCVITNFKQNVMITKSKPSQRLGAQPLHLGFTNRYWNPSWKISSCAPVKSFMHFSYCSYLSFNTGDGLHFINYCYNLCNITTYDNKECINAVEQFNILTRFFCLLHYYYSAFNMDSKFLRHFSHWELIKSRVNINQFNGTFSVLIHWLYSMQTDIT